jgi:hypothetical protein
MTLFLAVPALANDIYITQVGDNLDLDIVQDGSDNQFGDSTTGVTLNGDDMVFSITQTGDNNDIAAIINGADYSGTWAFTGNTNVVDFKCDSLGTAGAGNCEDVQLDITTTGDDNTFKFYIGETADAGGSVVTFTVTGDDNVVDADLDGVNANVTVVVNNSSSLHSGGATSATDNTLSASNAGNIIDIDVDGAGDANGHLIDLTVTGGGNVFTITQSGTGDNVVEATFTTEGSTVNITQSD